MSEAVVAHGDDRVRHFSGRRIDDRRADEPAWSPSHLAVRSAGVHLYDLTTRSIAGVADADRHGVAIHRHSLVRHVVYPNPWPKGKSGVRPVARYQR